MNDYRILVVDDEEDLCEILKFNLENEGYEVDTANSAEEAPEQITYQTLVIDITKKKVSIDGEEVALTKKEFEILFLLLQNKGRVFSREDILARVWSDEVYVLDRTIDVNITRLRKKIGIYGKRIVTRLGYGYCFETE